MAAETEANELIHWLIITAVHNNKLLEVKGKHTDIAEKASAVIQELEDLGCDRKILLNTVSYAVELPNLYPQFTAATLAKLATDIDDILTRMKRFTPRSINLPFIEESGELTTSPTGGDLHLSDELETELRRKAGAYKRLAELCSAGAIPDSATFRMISQLWPLIYVYSVTGKPHYALISRLLEFTEIQKESKALKVAFLKVQNRYPNIVNWLAMEASVLQITASFGFGES